MDTAPMAMVETVGVRKRLWIREKALGMALYTPMASVVRAVGRMVVWVEAAAEQFDPEYGASVRADRERLDAIRAELSHLDPALDPKLAALVRVLEDSPAQKVALFATYAATVRYLEVARKIFGRDDLAVVSYHMGIGNLETVVHDYASTHAHQSIGALVAKADLYWARFYFDSSPIRHVSVWRRLTGFGDDSETYYWRVLAAKEIMRLFRTDPGRLKQLAALLGDVELEQFVDIRFHAIGGIKLVNLLDGVDIHLALDRAAFRKFRGHAA